MLVAAKLCVALLFYVGACQARSCDEPGRQMCVSCRQPGVCGGASAMETTAAGGGRAEALLFRVDSTESPTELQVEPEGEECPANQACLEVPNSNTALCVPVEYTNCNNCNGQPTACDPFENTIVHACVPGSSPVKVKDCAEQTCRNGECTDSSAPITNPEEACAGIQEAEYVSVKPTCNVGILCLDGQPLTTFECSDGQYFDLETYKCKSLPINLCDGKKDGLFSNPTDCSEGVLCSGGALLAIIPCEPNQVYNIDTRACEEPSDSVTCSPMNGCTFEPDDEPATDEPVTQPPVTQPPVTQPPVTNSSTPLTPSVTQGPVTPSPSTRPSTCSASNVNDRYAHETDCKKYYTCRRITSTSYMYVESECSGTLVYNAVKGYCDLASNVSTC